MPFDGPRMFWAGFAPILDTEATTKARTEEPVQA